MAQRASAKTKLTPEAQKKLEQAIASDPFLKGDDIHLDLRSCPSLNALADTNFIDEDFAPLAGSADEARMRGASNATSLREFLQAEVQQTSEGPRRVHLGREVTGEVTPEHGEWVCRYEFQGQRHAARAKDRDTACLAASRHVMNWQPDTRELTDEELLRVSWIAQRDTGDGEQATKAAEEYLRLAIPRAGVLGMRVLSDPRFADVVKHAVFTAWAYSRDDYSLEDEQFPRFLKKYAKGKSWTNSLLNVAFAKYQEEQKRAERDALLQPLEREPDASEIVQGIESMSDGEVEAQMKRVIRSRAGR